MHRGAHSEPLCIGVLTLADSRAVPEGTIYRDVSWTSGARGVTSTFYVLLDEPTLATADDGRPEFEFYWFRGDPGTSGAGGLLTVAVTCSPVTDLDRLTADVRTAYGLTPDAEVTIAAVPVSSGSVSLAFAGGTGGATDALALGTSATAPAGAGPASFAVDLTADGAALLGQAIGTDHAVVNAAFDLAVPYVLDDITVRVWCDVTASCRTAADLQAAGALTPAQLSSTLVAHGLAGTSVSSQHPLSADEQSALTGLSDTIVASLLPGAIIGPDGSAVPYSADLEQRTNLTLTATYPGTVSLRRSSNLTLPADPADRVTTIDLSGDRLAWHVRVDAAGDYAAHGITLIAVDISYSGQTDTGQTITRSGSLALRQSATAGVVSFDLATPDQHTVNPHVQVHFADGSAPFDLDLPPTDSAAVDIDIDTLGVLMVDLQLGSADPSLSAAAVVELRYGDTTSPWNVTRILDAAQPTATWCAVVREIPGPYQYRVTWTAAPDIRITGAWQPGTDRHLILDAPAALSPPSTTVTALSAGQFDDLSEIVVELRAGPDAAISTLTFTAPGQSRTWTVPSTDATLSYQARQSLVERSGQHTVGPWLDETRPVLVAKDDLRFAVTVIGKLLGLGTTTSRAVVEIGGPDQTVPMQVLALTADADTQTCAVRRRDLAAAPGYRYRLTVRPSAGPDRTSDWLTGSSSILVLRPPD